ncbi:MAG: YitT family protein, partial [Deltaproteobacteria bacterium]|nr:YitT family protein [Deltaproteobacteria bacterium]
NNFITSMRWEIADLGLALRSWRFYRIFLVMIPGLLLGAAAINGVVIPLRLYAPGVSGLSLLWFYTAGTPSMGVIYLIMNIPIFLIGWREYALRYLVISVVGALMFTVALELTQHVRLETRDPLMAALLAGVLSGVGSGLYLRFGGSAGGMDILARFLKKRFGLPMGTTMNTVNLVNLAGAYLMFGLDNALYSAVYMWVSSMTMDQVQTGFSQRQAVLIISKFPEDVAQQVMRRLDRGVTFFHATGGFTKNSELVVYSIINRSEMGQLKSLLHETDPEAFLVVYNTSEVIGRTFLTWEDEGYNRPQTHRRASDRNTPPSPPGQRPLSEPPRR